MVVDRPGGRRGAAPRRLDKALKDARGLKIHLPHRDLAVDERAVRRAVRWGKAEDQRTATLDEVMKQRRQVERTIKAQLASGGVSLTPAAPPTTRPAESSGSKQLIIWSSILALLIIGVMVIVAVKLM